jgi:hypothetical protein
MILRRGNAAQRVGTRRRGAVNLLLLNVLVQVRVHEIRHDVAVKQGERPLSNMRCELRLHIVELLERLGLHDIQDLNDVRVLEVPQQLDFSERALRLHQV